ALEEHLEQLAVERLGVDAEGGAGAGGEVADVRLLAVTHPGLVVDEPARVDLGIEIDAEGVEASGEVADPGDLPGGPDALAVHAGDDQVAAGAGVKEGRVDDAEPLAGDVLQHDGAGVDGAAGVGEGGDRLGAAG